MTKAFNNKIENARKLIYQTERPEDFDAYLVNSREEQIPAMVTSRKGANIYSNFDTAADMYAYTPDPSEQVKEVVTTYAGRVDGGNFKWTFNNAVDDVLTIVNMELKTAITGYKTTLVGIQDENDKPIADGIGGDLCEILSDASSPFTVTNGSTSGSKGSVTVNGIEYTCCLKVGSSTVIAFTTNSAMTLTLVFNGSDGKKVEISNGVGIKTVSNGRIVVEDLPAGSYTIKKNSGESYLFYILLSESSATSVTTLEETSRIYLNGGIIRNVNHYEMQIYDAAVRLVYSGNGNADLSDCPHGVYWVRISGYAQTQKVIW